MTILDYVAIGVLMVLILLATPRLFAAYRRPGSSASHDGCSLLLVSPVLSPAWISVSSLLLERATMSQISSLPQPTQSVSRVLTADTPSVKLHTVQTRLATQTFN
jgi:hypothetical protein